ncbi:hypothetical protein [Cloacibacterium caeni]|uniref:hypothetical protein n=1 Tax=Cloacibacterium caeni TaxID=2004710 RepID=UPI001BCE47D9|nr:hypothetical protein [Cloacibacterium caeni]
MKKLFISFVLLFPLFVFSQEYLFDYMLKSTVKRENPDYNYQSYDMVNSKNHNLYMEVGRNNINHNYYSILVDNDKKIVSRFNLTDVNKNPIDFIYERGFEILNDYKVYYNFFNLKIENVGELKYKITPEKILKPANQIFEMEVQLEKFEDDLIIINFEPLSHEQELQIETLIKDKLKSENQIGNFYIKEIKIKYFKKSTMIKNVIPQKVDVILDLSKVK